jgi:hypothetical protein
MFDAKDCSSGPGARNTCVRRASGWTQPAINGKGHPNTAASLFQPSPTTRGWTATGPERRCTNWPTGSRSTAPRSPSTCTGNECP